MPTSPSAPLGRSFRLCLSLTLGALVLPAGAVDPSAPRLPTLAALARRAELQARIAAEPQRVKEILEDSGIDWCGMAAQTQERNPRRLMAGGGCPTEGPADLPANRNACIPNANTPFKTVRLKFNVFRNDDGSAAAATQAQVDGQVETLNAAYAPARIRFVHTTQFINSSKFRSLAYYVNSEEDEMKTRYADSPDRQHNIYVVDIEPDPDSGGSLLGVSTFPWDPAALQAGGGTILDNDSTGAGQLTLVHELGHGLGLWHTHHGVREVNQCSACWERADGRNGDTTGDLCADTPPTPVNYKCQAPGGTDACSGQGWGATAPQNYMGYAPDSCYSEFTPQQAGRLHCWIQDRLQGWLVTEQEVTVTLAATDPNAAEAGTDAGTFTITRTGATALPLTVNFTRDGTATHGNDYLAIGTSVVIPGGSATATVRVTPVNDTEIEPAETVILTLANGAGYQIGNTRTGTVSIVDDDAPTGPVATVAATDAAGSEAGPNPISFTVSRTGPTTAAMTVNYSLGGTATPADYTPALAGSVVIPAGTSTATLTVTPVDDAAAEGDETLTLTLAPGTGYSVGAPNNATATIADNDAPVSNVILAETFDRATPPTLPAGWTSDVADAGAPWRTTLLANSVLTNVVFALPTDASGEVRLVTPSFNVPAGGARLSFLQDFDLEDGYDGGVLEISIANGPFTDWIAAGGVFEKEGYNGTISADDGSAIAGKPAWTGKPNANVNTIARLPANAAGKSARMRWRLVSDPAVVPEGGGAWVLDLIEVTSLGGDAQTLVSVSATDANASEAGAGSGTFTITRTGSTAAPLTVNVSLGGTATAGADYSTIASPVTIAAGSSSLAVQVTPVDDATPEPLETVVLTVQAGTGYAVGAPASATVNLQDNDTTTTTGVVFAEAFDGVTLPNLPSGWSVTQVGAGAPWQTVAYTDLSGPNAAFAPNPDSDSDNALISPAIAIATGEAILRFDHGYILEDGYDGGVLEISIAGAPFTDILAAGGRFLSGGYDASISATDGSIIAGRNAWTGDSETYGKTEVQLPTAAAGKTVRLRWRLVTDGGVGGDGWVIDNVTVSEAGVGSALPAVSIEATDPAAAEYGPDAGEFTITRAGATTAPLTVRFGVTGSAQAGADYRALGTSVVIPAGSATAALRVEPIADATVEPVETVDIALETDAAYRLGTPASATVRLLDNGPTGSVVFGASFDDVTPPNLPPGWTAFLDGAGNPWASIADDLLSSPNRLFAGDPDNISDNRLTTPPIPIATATAQLVFLHQYQLEPGYDGAVLEIALGPNADAPFQDILAAGGTFVTGGYDGPLSLEDRSPIAGRNAWTGASPGPQVVRVNLPAAAAGKSIRLRWRCAADGGVSDAGYALDTVAVTEAVAAGNADLAISLQAQPSPVVADTPLTYTVTVTNRSAVAARGVVVSNALPAAVQFRSATVSQGTVSGTGPVVAQLGQVNARGTATLTVVVAPSTAGNLNASATVTGADTDPDLSNNAAAVSTAVLPTATPVFRYTNATAIVVSDAAGAATPYPSPLTVSGFEGLVGTLSVTLNGLSHTFPDDLDVLLVGPGGQKVMLMSDAGGDERFGLTYTTITFADDAAEPIPDRAQIVSDTYRPADYEAGETLPGTAPGGPYGTALAVFHSTSPNGTWQLFVADDTAKDSGRLAGGWSLTITRAAANVAPPTITTQPLGLILTAGTTASLTVAAAGTPPFAYQWRLNGNDLPGANQAALTLANVTPAHSGDYTVRVSNDGGAVLSQPATVTVTTQARQFHFGSLPVTPINTVAVPIELAAQGDENSTRFSLGFDVERLRFSSVTLGTDASGAALSANVNQLESGRLGLLLSLPARQTFAAGQRQIAVLRFDLQPGAKGTTPLSFLDAPSTREVAGATGQSLPADYLPTLLTLESPASGPTLDSVKVVAGTIQFTVGGALGHSFRVESSPDLRAWTPVTVLPDAAGSGLFSEPIPAQPGSKFYRAVQLP